jgi:hypothetical protein
LSAILFDFFKTIVSRRSRQRILSEITFVVSLGKAYKLERFEIVCIYGKSKGPSTQSCGTPWFAMYRSVRVF